MVIREIIVKWEKKSVSWQNSPDFLADSYLLL